MSADSQFESLSSWHGSLAVMMAVWSVTKCKPQYHNISRSFWTQADTSRLYTIIVMFIVDSSFKNTITAQWQKKLSSRHGTAIQNSRTMVGPNLSIGQFRNGLKTRVFATSQWLVVSNSSSINATSSTKVCRNLQRSKLSNFYQLNHSKGRATVGGELS